MNKLNKKGFTLIELLAVIAILAIIIIIVATSGFGAFDNAKNKISEENMKVVYEGARVLGTEVEYCDDVIGEDILSMEDGGFAKYNGFTDENKATCTNLQSKLKSTECLKVTVGYLKEKKFITGEGIKEIDDELVIKICKPADDIEVEFDKEDIEIVTTPTTTTSSTTTTQTTTKSPEPTQVNCGYYCGNSYKSYENSLTCTIMKDSRIAKNCDTLTFDGVATEELGMYFAKDDYGYSWYFRGAQSNNYVSFAGFTWRIVRINGDGSVRLILEGTLDKVKKKNDDGTYSSNYAGNIGRFNNSSDDNTYVGYMYGTANSDNYNDTHENINNSTAKTAIDNFYQTYLESYSAYLGDEIFCGDKTLGKGYTARGYKKTYTLYAAYDRIYNTPATPTLECAKNATDTYSRYTVNATTTSKNVTTNGSLTYPIGLITADELVMAGAYKEISNDEYYLYFTSNDTNPLPFIWTMTPLLTNSSGSANIIGSYLTSWTIYNASVAAYTNNPLVPSYRPVINLKADILVDSGDGTSTNPYTVKLN